MEGVTVLLSAMGVDPDEILCKLNISGPSVIIDQCEGNERKEIPEKRCLYVKTTERGLSKSGNMALREAGAIGAGLCIFCDNDVLYRDDYEQVIGEAFERNPDSDILVFFIERPERRRSIFSNERRLDALHCLKIFSPEIAFRLSSVRRAGLKMDELFGAGAKYGMGEENIFLLDALRSGLKITYVPIKIAKTIENESTWFKGYTRRFFINRGAGFYRMSPVFGFPLCLQFAVRKHGLYSGDIGFFPALGAMLKGIGEYRREKRYFIAGDHYSGTGPANATLSLIRAMPSNTLYQRRRGKIARSFEIAAKIFLTDGVVFSGHSRQNILGMRIARILKKPSVYIMHGAVEYENRINLVPDERMDADERRMMELADAILAVSSAFESWLKDNYPEYAGKTGHVTNGIDRSILYVNPSSKKEKSQRRNYVNQTAQTEEGQNPNYVNHKLTIISVGGGMPRKRIRVICRAVEILRKEGLDISLIVSGAEGADSKEIDSYPFVDDRGLVSREELEKLYRKSDIFIQNSSFETFGLAPAEALMSGCNVLISSACGIREVFKDLRDSDIIADPEDPEEIAEKIRGLSIEGNNKRLLSSLDILNTGWEKRAEELCQILEKIRA